MVTLWVIWNRPTEVDMAANAPADSFAFVECNNIAEVLTAIRQTEAWRTLAPIFQLDKTEDSPWATKFMRWTGIGPTSLVVSARAQLAIVVMNIVTSEEDSNLKVRPELAVVIETHTSARRIRPLVEELLAKLAVNAYRKPTFSQTLRGGTEFLIWKAPAENRQIVAVVDETAVIVGNSEEVIGACLAVRRGARPSLKSDVDLEHMRRTLNAGRALAFGYVPAEKTARLVSLAAPILLGTNDSGFQQLLPPIAAKLAGSIGWVTYSAEGTIEDRYLFSLPPSVLAQLRMGFETFSIEDQTLQRLVPHAASLTEYRFQDPWRAWRAFDNAMLSQLDAVSAVAFKSLMKSSLSTYGIHDPEEFLKDVGAPIGTIRVTLGSSASTVIATTSSENTARTLVNVVLGSTATQFAESGAQIFQGPGTDTIVAVKDNHIFVGSLQDVRACLSVLLYNDSQRDRIPKARLPASLTRSYGDDSLRVRNFFLAVATGIHAKLPIPDNAAVDGALSKLPMYITETTLSVDGLDRHTRSPLGQFGTLATLLFSQ
jgi:hypothetical protein